MVSPSASPPASEPARHLPPARPQRQAPVPPDVLDLSVQAVRLHAHGIAAVLLADSGGLIARADAERLAAAVGALVEELVEAGLWIETDLNFIIPVATDPHEGA